LYHPQYQMDNTSLPLTVKCPIILREGSNGSRDNVVI